MLSRGQIITEALTQIGRKDLAANARLWLNLFLDKIYRTQDFGWLIKESSLLQVSDGQSFPSDYHKMKTANLYLNSEAVKELPSVDSDQWFHLKRQGAITGAPNYVYIDQLNKKFYFHPIDSAYQWKFLYYHIPDLPDHTNSASDLEEATWGLHDDILIRAIQLKGLYYNDDQRYNQEMGELMKEIEQGKMNSHDRRAGTNRLKLGKSFARRF